MGEVEDAANEWHRGRYRSRLSAFRNSARLGDAIFLQLSVPAARERDHPCLFSERHLASPADLFGPPTSQKSPPDLERPLDWALGGGYAGRRYDWIQR